MNNEKFWRASGGDVNAGKVTLVGPAYHPMRWNELRDGDTNQLIEVTCDHPYYFVKTKDKTP